MREQILVVDSNDRPVGVSYRDEVIADSVWRRACGGVIIDPARSLVLCHKRSKKKDERPGLWVATFGGKAAVDESPEETAARELEEEFNIKASGRNLAKVRVIKSEDRKQFEHVFLCYIDSLSYGKENIGDEVEEFAWLHVEKVINSIGSRDWYNYGYERMILRWWRKSEPRCAYCWVINKSNN